MNREWLAMTAASEGAVEVDAVGFDGERRNRLFK